MQQQERSRMLGTMPMNKLVPKVAVPIMISMLVQALYNVVDGIFVARYSADAFTAVSLVFPVQMLMIAVSTGLGVGINSLISRRLGEKRGDAALDAAKHGIFLELCGVALFCLFGLFLSKVYMHIFTDDANLQKLGEEYLFIVTVFCLGLFMSVVFERMLQATGNTTLSMATQLLGAVVNIILDPIMIFGLLGCPRMGIAGAAIATVIGQFCGMFLGFILNQTRNHELRLTLRPFFRPHGAVLTDILAVGIPSVVMQAISSVMNVLMNMILLGFGNVAVNVLGAYFKLQSFVFMPVFGMNNGIVPIIAYNYGARKPDRIRAAAKLGFLYGAAIMAVGVLLFWLIPGRLLGIFNASDYMLEIGIPALRLISLSFLPAAFGIVTSSVCQALGHGVLSLIVSVLRQLVLILPVSWLLGHFVGLSAVWAAFPFAEVFSFLLSAVFMGYMFKTVVRPLEQPEP